MRTVTTIGLVAAALTALSAAPAAASENDTSRPGWYLGANGAYAMHVYPGPGNSFDIQVGARTKTTNPFGFNVKGGRRLGEHFSVELEYEWFAGFDQAVKDVTAFELHPQTITVNGKYHVTRWKRWQPFALLGLGPQIYRVSDRHGVGKSIDTSAVGLAGRVGVGLEFYVTPRWVASVGADFVPSTTTIDNDNPKGDDLDNLFYVPLQAGIQYRF